MNDELFPYYVAQIAGFIISIVSRGAILEASETERRLLLKSEAFKDVISLDLNDCNNQSLQNVLHENENKLVCISGEIRPQGNPLRCITSITEHWGGFMNTLRLEPPTVIEVPVLAKTAVSFEENNGFLSTQLTAHARFQGTFTRGRLEVCPCSLTSKNTAVVIELNQRDLARAIDDHADYAALLFELNHKDNASTALPAQKLDYYLEGGWQCQPLAFDASAILDLPRSAHTYADYWSGTFKRTVNLFIPTAAVSCSIIGRLSLEGGVLVLSAHPSVGNMAVNLDHRAFVPFLLDAARQIKQITIPFFEATEKIGLAVAAIATLGVILQWGRSDSTGDAGVLRIETTTPEQLPAETGSSHCVVCLTAVPSLFIVPCGHLCLCRECLGAFPAQRCEKCPICNGAVQKIMPIFSA